MADMQLYWFWVVCSALFVFSGIYCWLLYRITGDPLPGEMVWLFFSLAAITGLNALVRSGSTVMQPDTTRIIVRTAFIVSGVNSIATVVLLGRSYNGTVSEKLSVARQVRRLWRDLRQPKGLTYEARTCDRSRSGSSRD